MAKLRAWIKAHLRSTPKPSPQKKPADQLPFLPSPRRPITPTSLETLTSPFLRLPYDIRSIILATAFPRLILHIDLFRDESAREWKWRGAICIRNGECQVWMPSWVGPWCDGCVNWRSSCKRGFQGNELGVMGFLLSCRQAYTEGIDVLYSSNCIAIHSEPLLLHLPQLIPTGRLASITSLEIVVTAHRIEHDNGRPTLNQDHLQPILDNVATHCGQLRSLCLSLTLGSNRGYEELDGNPLPLIDTFYRSMRLRDMRVELPTAGKRAYWPAHDSVEDHPHEAPANGPFQRSKWRALDGEEPRVQRRSRERYPLPPLKMPVCDGDEGKESMGYWLVEGDQGPPPVAVSCF